MRQLAERKSAGIVVELLWNDGAPPGQDLYVEYRDERQDVFYTLYPPRDAALEAFYHPNAYVPPQQQYAAPRAAA